MLKSENEYEIVLLKERKNFEGENLEFLRVLKGDYGELKRCTVSEQVVEEFRIEKGREEVDMRMFVEEMIVATDYAGMIGVNFRKSKYY